jgi:quercetin dioxygenase-like cupin family protein
LELWQDGRLRTIEVGDVLFIPAGVIHSATNTGAGNEANS